MDEEVFSLALPSPLALTFALDCDLEVRMRFKSEVSSEPILALAWVCRFQLPSHNSPFMAVSCSVSDSESQSVFLLDFVTDCSSVGLDREIAASPFSRTPKSSAQPIKPPLAFRPGMSGSRCNCGRLNDCEIVRPAGCWTWRAEGVCCSVGRACLGRSSLRGGGVRGRSVCGKCDRNSAACIFLPSLVAGVDS